MLSPHRSCFYIIQFLFSCGRVTACTFHVSCSDVWSLGCVLYELCTLRHPVGLSLHPPATCRHHPSVFLFVCFCSVLKIACPVSGGELEEPDSEDLSGCVPAPPCSSAVRAPVSGQADVQDKPERQAVRAHHPDLSPGFQAPAWASTCTGETAQLCSHLLSFVCVRDHSCGRSHPTINHTLTHSQHSSVRLLDLIMLIKSDLFGFN